MECLEKYTFSTEISYMSVEISWGVELKCLELVVGLDVVLDLPTLLRCWYLPWYTLIMVPPTSSNHHSGTCKITKPGYPYLSFFQLVGGIQKILQCDWFLEREEFSHPDRHSGRNPSSRSIVNYFRERIAGIGGNRQSFAIFTLP